MLDCLCNPGILDQFLLAAGMRSSTYRALAGGARHAEGWTRLRRISSFWLTRMMT